MKRTSMKNIFLWYSAILVTGIIVQNFYHAYCFFNKVDTGGVIVMIFSIVLQIIYLTSIVKVIQGIKRKLWVNLVLVYWFSQIIFFDFFGNSYVVLFGPVLAVFMQLKGDFQYDYLIKLWHNELEVYFGGLSADFYIGFNLIAFIIFAYLFQTIWKNESAEEDELKIDEKR
jgi:hypothetical protein